MDLPAPTSSLLTSWPESLACDAITIVAAEGRPLQLWAQLSDRSVRVGVFAEQTAFGRAVRAAGRVDVDRPAAGRTVMSIATRDLATLSPNTHSCVRARLLAATRHDGREILTLAATGGAR